MGRGHSRWRFRRDACEGRKASDTDSRTNVLRGPEDVHVVGRNASSTQPAKLLVFIVKDKGAPVLVAVK